MRLSGASARQRFASARVARLATAAATGQPHLVPCTFVMHDEQVGIGIDDKPKSSTDLRRLRNIAANPAVSLLADDYSEDWTQLWWVRADGTASLETSPDAARPWWQRLAAKYPQYEGRDQTGPVIVVAILVWRGWAYADYPDPQRADGEK